jgi:hypothetical protein
MKLHVHVGVHKTATTYLQALVAKNLPRLNSAGVGAIPLYPFRNYFTRNFMRFPAGEFRIEDELERFFEHGVPPSIRGLILSDENLVGLCNGLIAHGKPYQSAGRRLAHLKALLEGHSVTLYMSIRSYDHFTSSSYCEAMRHVEEFLTFESFRAKFDVEALRWPAMIARFVAALKPKEVKLWRFEDFPASAETIFRDLAFDIDPGEQSVSAQAERPSFSEPAVAALETISARLGPKAAIELLEPITARLPKGRGKGEYPAFDPWSPDDHQRLAALYDQDCAAIPSRYWLIPPGGSMAEKKRVAAA